MKTQISFIKEFLLLTALIVSIQLLGSNANSNEINNEQETLQTIEVEHNSIPNFNENNFPLPSFGGLEGPRATISNSPEPFIIMTEITYEVETTSNATLGVYREGQPIVILANGPHEAGEHRVTLDAKDLPPGDYTAVLITDYGIFSKIMHK